MSISARVSKYVWYKEYLCTEYILDDVVLVKKFNDSKSLPPRNYIVEGGDTSLEVLLWKQVTSLWKHHFEGSDITSEEVANHFEGVAKSRHPIARPPRRNMGGKVQ